MTYERFKQLWVAAGLADRRPVENPIMVDNTSPNTVDALISASEGDFTVFDESTLIRQA